MTAHRLTREVVPGEAAMGVTPALLFTVRLERAT